MIMKNGKQIGFIYKNGKKIDKIIRHGKVYFEQGFTREKTSITLPITFGGIGKDLKDYKVYGNTVQNGEPTPDSPIEIKSCGDKSKNLFNKETVKLNYRFGSDGSEYADSWYLASDFIEVNGLEDYIYSRGASGGGSSCVCFYDNNKSFISRTMWQGKQNELSILINTPANTKYIRIADAKTLIDSMQVEEGDIATSYEPYYEGYKIPVNVRSDNLFNINSITPNTYITNAGATGPSQSTHLVDYIPAYKDKPIIVSYDYDTLVTTANRSLVFYDTNKNYISGQYYSPIPKKQQFIPEQDGYIRFAYDKNCTNIYILYYNETTNIYLDEPLRKIDEYSDYIDFINGKVVRRIKEIILDGTTNALSYYGKYGVDNAPLFYINKSDFILPIDYNQIIVASNCYRQFLIQSDRADTMFNYGIRGAISNHRIYLRDDRYKSANDMNNWLSSNNVIVDYVLETPIEEDIELPNIPTIDGNNTLNIETEITPSQVYIKYKSNN